MRRFFITASLAMILFGFVNQVVAQATRSVRTNKASLTGIVKDGQTGEALAGASVYFPDLKMGVVADAKAVTRFKTLLMQIHGRGFLYGLWIGLNRCWPRIGERFCSAFHRCENQAVTVIGVSAPPICLTFQLVYSNTKIY
jgi:hypothetical protein